MSGTLNDLLADSCVFITGVTGLLGSLLLQRIISMKPGPRVVYVLIRKKGTANARLQELLSSPLFKGNNPSDLGKIQELSGDMSKQNLGLSEENLAILISQCNLVFHMAANVSFVAPLKSAVKTNICGSRNLLIIAREMKHLNAMVHVSTCFANINHGIQDIEEKLYTPLYDPMEFIDMIRDMSSEEADRRTRELIGNFANTYTFSKQMAECLLARERDNVPLCIVRPSVVLNTWKKPFPGWVTNINNSIVAFTAGIQKGIFQIYPMDVLDNRIIYLECVPADVTVSSILAAALYSARNPSDFRIFHCAGGILNPITLPQYCHFITKYSRLHPCKNIMLYPDIRTRKGLRYFLGLLFLQIIPSIIVDLVSFCLKNPPKKSLFKMQLAYKKTWERIRSFGERRWFFRVNNLELLTNILSPQEKEEHPIDIKEIDWDDYCKNCVLGLREFYHKETPTDAEDARYQIERWRKIVNLIKLFLLAILWLALTLLGLSIQKSLAIIAFLILFYTYLCYNKSIKFTYMLIGSARSKGCKVSKMLTSSKYFADEKLQQAEAIRTKNYNRFATKECSKNASTMASNVTEFYRDKNIFITGGTGFLGVCLIEKLLRCCPDIKNIYLLVRPKKGKNVEQRIEELAKNSVFNRLREEGKIDSLNKLIPVAGDVGEENLGLSSVDRLTLVEHINVIFHSAATLDFEADLKSTTNINLLGTRRVVQLAQEVRSLKALIHVSSAYVNSALLEVNEIVYPPPTNVEVFLQMIETVSNDELIENTPKILQKHPNPYTFTKHLAEHEIIKGKLPAAIVRPSMIVGAWQEPVPGWTTSKNGPQGFLMGASKGIVRRLPVGKSLIYDYIPVDIVVNNLIVAGYAVARDSDKNVKVYHCTSSTCKPFKWEAVEDKINVYLHKFPLKSAVWYPHLKLVPSLFLFRISAFFVHMIPAYILDTVTKICGGRPILVRLHTNVNKSLVRLEKFIFTEWIFHNPKTMALHDSLSEVDKKLFTLDIRSLKWDSYFIDLTQGVRTYLNNEHPKSLDKARRKDNILLVAHLILQALLLLLVWWMFKALLGSTWTKTGLVVPITYFLFSQL
ncbi:uncharacterized protein [Prorops nasuta]|uniref:uncharacterized protein n=1 Tax=Prorops nasuta TaxID=863751 RepID=UPI0034CE86B6